MCAFADARNGLTADGDAQSSTPACAIDDVSALKAELEADRANEAKSSFLSSMNHDIRMSVMDGREVTRTIRALKRPDAVRILIIAMTADALEEDIQRTKHAGMTGYVVKPVNPDQLHRALSDDVRVSAGLIREITRHPNMLYRDVVEAALDELSDFNLMLLILSFGKKA